MKAQDVHDLSGEELAVRMDDLKGSYMKLRFQHATAQLDNVNTLKTIRRDIARVMTVMNERKRAVKKIAPKES